jgi:AcrR family transcriptional regulator
MAINIRTFSVNEDLVTERRTQIIRGALKVFIRKGYARSNMREVAKACEMSAGNLYHYFGSKGDILDLIITSATSRQVELIESSAKEFSRLGLEKLLRKLMEVLYQWHDTNQDTTLFIYQETKNLSQSARKRIFDTEYRIMAVFEELLKKSADSGVFKIEDPKLVAHNIIALSHMWALRRWLLRKHWDSAQYIKEEIENIFKLIGADIK